MNDTVIKDSKVFFIRFFYAYSAFIREVLSQIVDTSLFNYLFTFSDRESHLGEVALNELIYSFWLLYNWVYLPFCLIKV